MVAHRKVREDTKLSPGLFARYLSVAYMRGTRFLVLDKGEKTRF
jgi:hypothetical protein